MSDGPEYDAGGPIIRDKRRFDPVTGERRTEVADPATSVAPGSPVDSGSAGSAGDAGTPELELALAERTADLQRVQAEYANYRRRVERDRQAVGEQALAAVIAGLLPVLDDIDRARAHGEASEGFAVIADGLEAALGKLGLARFGDAGEPFDPTIHEALTHGFSDQVAEPVCAEVYQPGYRVGQRVMRPARVAVLEPEQSSASDDDVAGDPTGDPLE